MREPQTVDPEVSRAKFDREVAAYREHEATFRAQGRFLVDAVFPEVFAVFAAAHLKPPPLVAGVVIDFTDYDLRPPSVTFVDPLTRAPLTRRHLPIRMLRRPEGVTPEALTAMLQAGMQLPDMIQFWDLDAFPFLCLPGVREYHDNPGHTGDPWLMHRGSSEGSLAFILEKIWSYGVNPITNFQVLVQAPALTVAVDAGRIPE